MTQVPALSTEREREIRAAVRRRRTLFGEVYLEVIGHALTDISHHAEAEDVATARQFLLDPDSPVRGVCELLAIDYERLRRKALRRSVQLEAMRATLAAHNRRRAREQRRRALV